MEKDDYKMRLKAVLETEFPDVDTGIILLADSEHKTMAVFGDKDKQVELILGMADHDFFLKVFHAIVAADEQRKETLSNLRINQVKS